MRNVSETNSRATNILARMLLRGQPIIVNVRATCRLLVLVACCVPQIALTATPIIRMGGQLAPPDVSRPLSQDEKSLSSIPLAGSWVLPAPTNAERMIQKSLSRAANPPAGFGRSLNMFGLDGRVTVPSGVDTVRLEVVSTSAESLRVGLYLGDNAAYNVTAFAPGASNSVVTIDVAANEHAQRHILWTGITRDQMQDVVVRRLSSDGKSWTIEVERVSHIDNSPFVRPKNIGFGTSAYCQHDIACAIAAAPPAMQSSLSTTTNAVALIATTNAMGSTSLCTGTLLTKRSVV